MKPLVLPAQPILVFHWLLAFRFHETFLKFSKTTITLKMVFPSKYLTGKKLQTSGHRSRVSGIWLSTCFCCFGKEAPDVNVTDGFLGQQAGVPDALPRILNEGLPDAVRSINFTRERGLNHLFQDLFIKKGEQNESGPSLTKGKFAGSPEERLKMLD